MGSLWHTIRHLFSGPQLPWTMLLVALAVLIVGLIVLTRTNWGQSHALHKCVAMSLLVHLLLAAYATTVEIVTAGSPDGNSDRGVVSISLVSDAGNPPDDQQQTKDAKPWDKLLPNSTAIPDAPPLEHREPQAATGSSTPAIDPLAATKPLLEKLPAMFASLTGAANPTTSAVASLKPAAPIDAAQRPVAQKTDAPAPVTAPPERLSTAHSQNSTGDPEMKFASDAKPQAVRAGADLTSPPIDPSSAKGSNADEKLASPIAPAAMGSSDEKSGASKSAAAGGAAGSSAAGSDSQLVMVPIGGVAAKPASGASANTGGTNGSEPEVYRDRTASDRLGILRRRGGSPETEAAVQAALKWLASNQSTDGHWDAARFGAGRETMTLGQNRSGAGARAESAMTGLALLALLGSGNTHREGLYADNVRRGLNYLIGMQAADGNLGGQAGTNAVMYSHGIATFALSEDYAMTHDQRLERSLRSAIGYTVAAQNPSTGGWRYLAHESGDTSQLGWQLMALKSAELAGIAIPETTRNGAVRFLGSVASGANGGLASYRPYEAPSRAMTAEALACRQFAGTSRDSAANEASNYLLGELPNRERVNLYYWYYGTLAMYQLGGERWQQLNKALQAALLDDQIGEGDLAGSWDPKCIWGGYGGRVYSTAMSALCLEIYYRFLPLYNANDAPDSGEKSPR
ncbi:MAG TPA: hypothetical protein VGH32_11375 [Pirellulales bacterium]